MKNTHKLYTDVIAKSGSKNDPLEVTANGVYEAPEGIGYNPVKVNVPQTAQSGTLKAVLDATQSASYLFDSYTGTSVNGLISRSDTANVTNMRYMFHVCQKLTSIPQLDTSKVTDMQYMFYYCQKLTSIPQLDTSKVTNMQYMFYACTNLTSIPQLDTSKVTDMYYMFGSCTNLTSIPQLDTSKVTDMGSMFFNCNKLKEIHMTGMKVSFDIHFSKLFTREALLEIINNLATITSTRTLTMGSINLSKLTDEDKSIATNKGWTLA